jgi:hypothetical protein
LLLTRDFFAISLALIVTLILSELSFRLVEERSRLYLKMKSDNIVISIISFSMLLIISLSYLIYSNQGFSNRLPVQAELIFNEVNNVNPRRQECHVSGTAITPTCTYGGEKLGVIVAGDSHAAVIMRTVERALPDKGLHVLDLSLSRCLIAKDVNTIDGNHCKKFVDKLFEYNKKLPPNVPLIMMYRTSLYLLGENEADYQVQPKVYTGDVQPLSRSEGYFSSMENVIVKTACELSEYRNVYMVKPIPELKKNVPKYMGRSLMLGSPQRVSVSLEEYQERNYYALLALERASKKCGVVLLDPVPYLCNATHCYGDKNGHPIYIDDNHLSERGAELLFNMFLEVTTALP